MEGCPWRGGCVGFRVSADPWGSNTGVSAEISPPTYLNPSAMLGSKLRKEQHKRHMVYTGSGHRCGVIPYSSVWWISSWSDDDEQYKEEQPREGLFLAGAMNCWEEFNHLSLSLSP